MRRRPVANAQFALLGITRSETTRRAFRELAITAPELDRYAGGMLLDREAFRQRDARGARLVDVLASRRIVPGVALFAPHAPLTATPGENVVEGADGLRGRLAELAALGARFAEMRATFRVTAVAAPTDRAIAVNAHVLARFAALAQEVRIVPVVGIELDPGAYDVERAGAAIERILRGVIAELAGARVALDALVLEVPLVTPGGASVQHAMPCDVVRATLDALGATVPVAVAGIAFTAGGSEERDATEHLCAVNRTMPRRRPWPLTFAFGAEMRETALAAWRGRPDNVADAQAELVRCARTRGLAACGATAPAREPLRRVAAAA